MRAPAAGRATSQEQEAPPDSVAQRVGCAWIHTRRCTRGTYRDAPTPLPAALPQPGGRPAKISVVVRSHSSYSYLLSRFPALIAGSALHSGYPLVLPARLPGLAEFATSRCPGKLLEPSQSLHNSGPLCLSTR